jgi:hypothetical protein
LLLPPTNSTDDKRDNFRRQRCRQQSHDLTFLRSPRLNSFRRF